MTYFIAGNTAVENARTLARSALPDAPQLTEDESRPSRGRPIRARLATVVGTVLRAMAKGELELADRLDPRRTPSPG